MSSRATIARALVVLALGCGDDGGTPPPPSSTTPPTPAEFRGKAHLEAYERLLPLARVALDHGDPLTAAQLDGGPPAPLPFTLGARAVLRKDIDAAWVEAEEIDGDALGPERAALLRAIRFGLSRLRDEHVRKPSTRIDPAVGLRATTRLLDDLDRRGPGCEGCDAALSQAAQALDAAVADVGATSLARANAAREDADALRERLKALPADVVTRPGASALLAALAQTSARIGAMASALASAKPQPLPEQVAPARDPGQALRLPDRMGSAALRRWLDVHESEAHTAQELVQSLAPALVQLDTLARKDAAEQRSKPAPTPAPVDVARCESAWQPLAAFVKTQPALAAATLDCAAALRRLPARADDATLATALVQLGVVEPTELAQRARVDPLLARIGGTIAPASHRHALAIATLSGLGRTDARARVLAAARDDVCLAITALWIHGELGDDAALGERLGTACDAHPRDAWIALALARPERALDGLGLSLLALGPADAVALEQLWWLPIGLVVPMARPSKPVEQPARVHTERIVPGQEPSQEPGQEPGQAPGQEPEE